MFLVIDIVVLSYYVLTYCFLFLLSFPVIPLSLFFLSSFSCYSFPVISFPVILFLLFLFLLFLFLLFLSSCPFPGYTFILFFSRCFVPVISFLFFRSPCFPADPPGPLQPASEPGLMRQRCSFIRPAVFSLLRCPRNGSSRMPDRLLSRQGLPQDLPLPRSLRRSHRRRVLS